MNSLERWARIWLVWLCLLLLGGGADSYRYTRRVTASSGWTVLELPDDVLAAARPGLPDLRLFSGSAELAFVFEDSLTVPANSLPFIDVTREHGRDTMALVDRGEHRDLVDSVDISIGGTAPFLKPVVLESSEDRTRFREVARAEIFRTREAQMTRVNFAPNDARYLRLRFDDRDGVPLEPLSARLTAAAPAAPRERPVSVIPQRRPASAFGESYAIELPSENLPAVALELKVAAPVFSRQTRVYEVRVFRGDLGRRLVGEGRIERTAQGAEQLRVPLSDLTSRNLQVEIEALGPPLAVEHATLWVSHKRLVFHVPNNAPPLSLQYGSQVADAPSYDLAEALASGLPRNLAVATLAPVEDHGEKPTLPRVLRGPPIQPTGFARRRAITLPPEGPLAYLDLVGIPVHQADRVRIVDAAGRQVPFVVESEPRAASVPLKLSTHVTSGVSVFRASGFDPMESAHSITLEAQSPAYFRREVSVYENRRDERGSTGRHLLGRGIVERPADGHQVPLSVPLGQPTTSELLIEVEHGDNPTLVVSKATLEIERARIDFVFEADDELVLLSDSASAPPAAYDLALVRDALTRLPANRAALVDTPAPTTHSTRPWWFWLAITGAAGLVIAALLRVLRGT